MLTQQQRYQGLPRNLVDMASALRRALSRRDFDDARIGVAVLTKHAPQHPEVLRLRGAYDFARGEPALALQSLAAAVRSRPRDDLIYHHLGGCYEQLGDNAHALKAFQSACNENPERPEYWVNFGRALTVGGWNAHAAAAFQQAVKLAPDDQRARAMLASALNLEGRADDAAGEYRKILAQHPGSGLSWWGLAVLKPMPLGDDDVQTMRGALADADLDNHDRMAIHFALAHALEAQHDYAGALDSLDAAHALAALGRTPWDGAGSAAELERILDAFATPRAPHADDLGREVIFIVSLPRSGSTLVEQILASHSQVTGTAELPDLPQVLSDASMRHGKTLPEWAPTLNDESWRSLGEAYLQRTARWRQDTPRHTDKMPDNWHHIGAILSMLPHARVVVVRRDRLETTLACYRMLLDGHDYTHTFAGLAECWRQFDHAIDVWQSRCPDRVRVQSYEALTAEPDAQIRALLDFCDLPFEQSCIDFHATQRRVTTPSAAQVRQPMRRDTARADQYGALLDPLREALGLPHFDAAGNA